MQRKLRALVGCLLLVALLASCNFSSNESIHRFYEVAPSHSRVDFENRLREDDDFNIIEYLYFYNGGGVALGDINNDGLIDLYFSANQESNKLYLNRGGFTFEDITEQAGAEGVGNWKTGVVMADVNGDDLLDIFICGVGGYKKFNGRSQLLINNGDLTFTDKTDEFGLGFQGFSTHASFFDYDNDGDLDLYLLNHSVHSVRSYGDASYRFQSDPKAGDKLYRNELIPAGQQKFTEVTSQAGIFNSQIGYGLGVAISDLNQDGFLDIYVSNDFHENDYLYINRRDGTFAQELEQSIPHTSRFSMGNDVGDVNNDGWQDIVTLDMLPYEEQVIKASGGEDPYEIFQFKLGFGYHYQYARNALQINRGLDQSGKLLFSDVASYAGVAATDWSWAPLLADFDNDGWKDLFVANGIVRRPNDLDYITYISSDSAQRFLTDREMIDRMPSGAVPNFLYRNQGDLTFADVSADWIGSEPTLSNGAAYADIDNDGDLDLVINNINKEATLYRNDGLPSNFLRIELEGTTPNSAGIGAKVYAFAGGRTSYQEMITARGWQSSVEPIIHFGLGASSRIDSLLVIWPDRSFEIVKALQGNQKIVMSQKNATGAWKYGRVENSLWTTPATAISFVHQENEFNAFEKERLIPHTLSAQGPKISCADFNGDHLDDIYVGGARDQAGKLFIQRSSGSFTHQPQSAMEADSVAEDTASAFGDFNGDGAVDLVVVSGGQETEGISENLRPRLYLSDGKGKFSKSMRAMPEVYVNASCVKAMDYDGDNDLDLFVGGRVVAGRYGVNPSSFLLLNDGTGNFSVDTRQALLVDLGMVSDATWSDLNSDGQPDLVVVGEWMPITILMQGKDGVLIDKTENFGLADTRGWWNTVQSSDFDQDGDIDFLVGNLGLNARLKASFEEPVELWVGDIDLNGSTDPILAYYNHHTSYPFASRDQLVKQVPPLKRKFLKYSDYINVSVSDLITADRQKDFVHKWTNNFASGWLENRGDKNFVFHLFPSEAQLFPIYAIEVLDINKDGVNDVVAVGNNYGAQPEFGRYDAGYGLVMLGSGKGALLPQTVQSSGFVVRGEGRDLSVVKNARGETMILVARNNDSILTFKVQ